MIAYRSSVLFQDKRSQTVLILLERSRDPGKLKNNKLNDDRPGSSGFVYKDKRHWWRRALEILFYLSNMYTCTQPNCFCFIVFEKIKNFKKKSSWEKIESLTFPRRLWKWTRCAGAGIYMQKTATVRQSGSRSCSLCCFKKISSGFYKVDEKFEVGKK